MADEKTYVVTTGSHDGYQIVGVYEGPAGLDVATLAKEWAREFPGRAEAILASRKEHEGVERLDAEGFLQWLLAKAGLVLVGHKELHVPDYFRDLGRLLTDGS